MALEFIQCNEPSDLRYSQRVEVTMNFLNREVLGEPYYPFPNEDGLAPLLFGMVDDGRLIAAASVEHFKDRQLLLGLLGVAADRRCEGLGSALLKEVEQCAVELGALAIVVDPLDDYRTQPNGRVRQFFGRHSYVGYKDMDPQLLMKVLPGDAIGVQDRQAIIVL